MNVAGLIGVATNQKNGLLDKSFAVRTEVIQPNGNYELTRVYSLVCIRETNIIGLSAIISTLWTSIKIISENHVNDNVFTFKSNNKGGLIITNTSNKTITFSIRVIM